jgi:uncharacterized membrane protein YdjX (TVP38/TMEM64 family)
MASMIELIIIFLTSLGFNLIPFAGPSNLLIASNAVLLIEADAWTLLAIGFLVATGASVAKSVHYLITFFVSQHLSEKRKQRLDEQAAKVKRWAFLLLYVAAATPIPDEPVVIPLGLMKYSPTKFFAAFFLGKLTITIAGAFFGAWTKSTFLEWLSPEVMIVLSIVLTIVITVILLKVDVGKLAQKIQKMLKKKPSAQKNGTDLSTTQ